MIRPFLCVLLTLGPGASFGFAELVTVHFTGRVTSIDDPSSLLTVYQTGDTVSGSYTFETERIDIDPDPAIGYYGTEFPPGAYSITIGSITTSCIGGVETMVWNDVLDIPDEGITNGDGLLVQTSFDHAPPCDLGGTGLELLDPSGTALASDQNPTDFLPDHYAVRRGVFVVGCAEAGGLSRLEFEILSITSGAVPAASAWGLGITALLLVTIGTVRLQRGTNLSCQS